MTNRDQPALEADPCKAVNKARLEMFSDGVIAIVVTIMVLELRPPEEASLRGLLALWPTLAAYVLSFALIAIYWVNHHDLLHAARRVGRATLWLNAHFLFWLSFYPFAAAFIGEARGASFAVALYAALSILVAVAYLLLTRDLARHNPDTLGVAGRDRAMRRKNVAAIVLTLAAIPMAYLFEPVAILLLAAPAVAYALPIAAPTQ